MKSLLGLASRQLRRRPGRYALTAAGVMLGVAVLFGVLTTTAATTDALNRYVDRFTGTADVVIGPSGAYDSDLPGDLLAQLRAMPDVEHVLGELGLRTELNATRSTGDCDATSIRPAFIEGVDFAAAEFVRPIVVARGAVPVAGRNDLVLAPGPAADLCVDIGDEISVSTPAGDSRFAVVGILDDSNEFAAGGIAGYSTPAAVQAAAGKGDVYSGVSVDLREGADRDAWIDGARATLGDRYLLVDRDNVAGDFRAFMQTVTGGLTLIGTIALFVAAFLIFLTFTVAVAERTRVYGTLRALGAHPSEVRKVVVTEAALLGLVCSAAGLIVGYGLATVIVSGLSNLVDLSVDRVGFRVGTAVFSVIVGVLTTVIAALLPARRAAAISPVAAMRGLLPEDKRARPWVGLALLAAALLLDATASSVPARALGNLLALAGAVLLVPVVLRPLALVLGRFTRYVARGVGNIAVLHLTKERSRSSYTLALLMVVMSMIIGIASSHRAMSRTADEVIARQFGGDFEVEAVGALDASAGDRLLGIPGVEEVSPLRFGVAQMLDGDDRRTLPIEIVDPASYFDMAGFPWVDGDDATARTALAAGGSVLLPAPIVDDMGLALGDTVTVVGSDGPRPFSLAGSIAALRNPALVIGIADNAHFGNARPNAYMVNVVDGTSIDDVIPAVEAMFGEQIDVMTQADFREEARQQLNGFFGIAYAILLVAAVIGLLGLANTLVVSVLQRTREVGILRSVGVSRRQVRGMVVVEAATLVLVAWVLAIFLGALTASTTVRGFADSLGFTIAFSYPWSLIPFMALVALAIGVLASILPARRAARIEVVTALRFD